MATISISNSLMRSTRLMVQAPNYFTRLVKKISQHKSNNFDEKKQSLNGVYSFFRERQVSSFCEK